VATLQVRIAETQFERENKLFIGMLPKTVNEQDLHNMFISYGELREVHIIRGPEGSPKGCAFVKFVGRDAAIAAIENMNDTIPMVFILYNFINDLLNLSCIYYLFYLGCNKTTSS
jgi:RNA recognition motif-containing protein